MLEKVIGFAKKAHCPWFLVRKVEFIKAEFSDCLMAFFSFLPGEIGSKLRTRLIAFQTTGKKVRVLGGTLIEYPKNLAIGDKREINRNCH